MNHILFKKFITKGPIQGEVHVRHPEDNARDHGARFFIFTDTTVEELRAKFKEDGFKVAGFFVDHQPVQMIRPATFKSLLGWREDCDDHGQYVFQHKEPDYVILHPITDIRQILDNLMPV